MTTAYVLSGGASLGSIQVGMALALEDAGVAPDLVVGTSVGAINGAWIAGGRPLTELAATWRSLTRADLFPLRPLVGLRGFLGRRDHLVPSDRLRRVLEQRLPFTRLEDAALPLTVIATDARSGTEVPLSAGPAVPAILASAALPGVFPPVEVDGRSLIDGGVTDNTPITRAIERGADEVWVLSTGYSCRLSAAPRGAVAMAMHAIAVLVQQRLELEVAHRRYDVPVHLIPPPCPITVTPIDFSQTDELIERARIGTAQWLTNGQPQAMPLLHHEHS